MAETEFRDQARGFADAILANRTASIIEQGVPEKRLLTEEEAVVVDDAIRLLSSCQAGLRATQKPNPPEEFGFLEWMENLRHYETAFDAIMRSRLANKEGEIEKTLEYARQSLLGLKSGKAPANRSKLIHLFNSISEVNLDVAVDSCTVPPQEIGKPEELAHDRL